MADVQQEDQGHPRKKYKDLGDGSFAEYTALEPASIGGTSPSSIVNIADPTIITQKAAVSAAGRLQVELPPGGGSIVQQGAKDVSSTPWDVALTNASVAVTGPLTDAQLRASAVTVSGPLTDSQLRATPVPVSGTVGLSGAVDTELTTADLDTGVGVDTRAVIGVLWADAGGAKIASLVNPLPVQGTVGVNNFPASQAVTGTFWQATQPVSGTFFQATQPVSLATNTPDVTDRAARLLGHVNVDNASLAVTGTFWQATQPVSGTVTAGQGVAAALAAAWPVKVTDGTNTGAVKAASALAVAVDPAQVVQLSPQSAQASNLAVTVTAATGVAATLTIPAAAAGLFHYISLIEIELYATVARTGGTTPVIVTTTNLPGSPAWDFDTGQAIGTTIRKTIQPATPIKSSVAATATTIVAPIATTGIWRITAYYYTAP